MVTFLTLLVMTFSFFDFHNIQVVKALIKPLDAQIVLARCAH